MRIMPKAGFWVMPPTDVMVRGDPNNIITNEGDIFYTTGIRGKGGHKYWRPSHDINNKGIKIIVNDLTTWVTLLWTCVPGKEEIKNYVYAEDINHALYLYKTLPHLKYPR